MALSVPFKEVVDDYSPSELSFDSEGAHAALKIDVAWDDRFVASKECVGFSFREVVAGVPKLRRVRPQQHPIFQWLWCTGVTAIQGLGPLGKETAAQHHNLDGGAKYDKARISLAFGTLPYDVLADDDVNGEFERYVERHYNLSTEFLTLQQGHYKFAEGVGGLAIPIPGSKGQLTTKMTVAYVWHQVPTDCLFSGGKPTNLMSVMGKVNSVAFDGFEVGTLLCLPPNIKPTVSPVPATVGLIGTANRMWTVEIPLLYFNPKPFGADFLGHNLAPVPGQDYWALATHNGTLIGNRIYQQTDFAALFTPL